MYTQVCPVATDIFSTDDGRGTGRVLVRYQVGECWIDDEGYDVWDSFHGEVMLPEAEVATALENHIADRYPGLELIDWHIPIGPDPF